MAEAYFVQECPTCGRSLQIRVDYLGKQVICQHCRGRLVAHAQAAPVHRGINIMQRASELIDLAEQRAPRPR